MTDSKEFVTSINSPGPFSLQPLAESLNDLINPYGEHSRESAHSHESTVEGARTSTHE